MQSLLYATRLLRLYDADEEHVSYQRSSSRVIDDWVDTYHANPS